MESQLNLKWVCRYAENSKTELWKVDFNVFPQQFGVVKVIQSDDLLHARREGEVTKLASDIHQMFVKCHLHYQRGTEYQIVLEHFDSRRETLESECRHLNEFYFIKICKDLIEAMDALHRNGVCHGGIKIENLVIADSRDFKIANFSSAKFSSEPVSEIQATTDSHLTYKTLKSTNEIGFAELCKEDVWCMGRTLLQIASSNFEANILQKNTVDVSSLVITKMEELGYRHEIARLLIRMLEPDSSYRPSFNELINHSALNHSSMSLPRDEIIITRHDAYSSDCYTIDHLRMESAGLTLLVHLSCDHWVYLESIIRKLEADIPLEILRCSCGKRITYTYLKNCLIDQLTSSLDKYLSKPQFINCPRCKKVHQVTLFELYYMSIKITCSCSATFCCLCLKKHYDILCSSIKVLE